MSITYNPIATYIENIWSIDQVKNYLRISHDYDDELLENLLNTAIEYAENFTGEFIYIRDFECIIRKTPNIIYLKHTQINEIESIQ